MRQTRVLRWRRNRDSNPSAQLRAYELSKPTPSTTWVFLRMRLSTQEEL